MRKRWFLVGVIFLLLSWLLVGCGVAQEQYDAAVADLGKAQQEVQTARTELASVSSELGTTKSELASVSSELGTMKSELASVSSELGTMKSELASVSSELGTTKSELESAKNQLSAAQSLIEAQEQAIAKAKTEAEIINALFIPVLKGEEGEIDPLSFLFEWRDKVEATNDPVLKLKFDAVMDSEGGDEELLDFFLYLFENIEETLQ